MVLELEVQVVNRFSNWLIFFKVKVFQVGVSQGISNVDSSVRIEGQQFFKQINGLRIGKGKEFVEIFAIFLILGKIFDQLFAFFRNMLHVVNIRSSQILADELNLIFGVSSRKERFSLQHFSKNASNTPHIDRGGVVISAQKQFRSSVPSSSDILGENIGLEVVEKRSSQPKVTYFKITVRIDEKISWFLH